MTNFMDDLSVIDPSTVETSGQLYPVAQWLNGDPKMAAAGGVQHTGGIIMPTKYLDDGLTPAPGWTRANVSFSSGKSEQVLAAQKPRLAIVRTRFRWFVRNNGEETYYPRAAYAAGMRGHLQVLVGVAGYDFPAVVTFKGKASQEFERLLKDFQKVQDAAAKIIRTAGTAAMPRFAFWMRLAPGPHVKAGQKGQESIITPPMLDLPETITPDYLNKVYVGRENLLTFQQLYHDAAEWAAAWDMAGAEANHDDTYTVDEATGEITDAVQTSKAPAIVQSDSERWMEFCTEHSITRADVVRALRHPTPGAYLKAHPEDTLPGAMQKILDARNAAQQPADAPDWLANF